MFLRAVLGRSERRLIPLYFLGYFSILLFPVDVVYTPNPVGSVVVVTVTKMVALVLKVGLVVGIPNSRHLRSMCGHEPEATRIRSVRHARA